MSNFSIRVETIALSISPTTSGGQIDTPNQRNSAQSGSDPLSTVQRAAKIGDSVPIVFGRRVGNAGGVLVSPPATEARFTNNSSNDVTAYYLVLISEGRIDPIQVRDVFQQSCRVGAFTQAFDRRAGTWGPGNFVTTQTGFEDSVPDAPIYCGSGTGSYAGTTTGSFINTIPHPFTQWDRQVHMFVRGGMWLQRLLENGEGPSNNVADLVRWLIRRSSRVPDELIDVTALTEAARFTNANGLWCNICIEEPSNLADWLATNLGYFLLRESRTGGKRGLRPLLPFDPTTGALNTSAVGWSFTFTEDHVLPGSMEISYSSRMERQPFCCQVVWRQQPEDGLGLARIADVRYAGSALDGPFEQHDISAFATTENHAFKVGAYILARRRYIDHRLVFSVRTGSFNETLAPGDIVRVLLQRVASVGTNSVHDYLYEVERIGRSVTGEAELELTHFPVDDQGRSLVALDVSTAQGNGLMLPTGRADVACDLNSSDDTSVTADLGPWDGWEVSDPDPDIGSGLEESVNDTFIPEDWGAEPENGEQGDAYTASVSFSTPLITYPDVWYAILSPNFATASVTVTVSNPPVDGSLMVNVTDGDASYRVVIPEDKTSTLITVNASGDSVSAVTSRTFAITSWSGGGYIGDESTAALDISATAAFTIVPYVGIITLQRPGIWERDAGAWVWAGPEDTGDFAWNQADQKWTWNGAAADWVWDAAQSRWQYPGTATGWSWNITAQRWVRSTTDPADATTKPADPPEGPPSPLPSAVTPAGKIYTVVAQASVDKPAIPNGANDLAIDLQDFDDASSVAVGTLVIPAISMMFGAWQWNPAAGWWEYPTESSVWRWHSADATWQYIGADADKWSWNQADQEWAWIGESQGSWQWNGTGWEWTGEEAPEPGDDPPNESPPGNPPTQNSSNHPPDAARWVYSSGWTGTAHWPGGTEPDFTGLLSGRLTYHM